MPIIYGTPDEVLCNDYNPNEMSPGVFTQLVEDLKKEGELDQPVVVVPVSDIPGKKYVVVDGEHRYRASLVAGFTEIPLSVKKYSQHEAKVATVRRNILRGDLNALKFTKMVVGLADASSFTVKEIQQQMAMSDKDFMRTFKGKLADSAKKAKEIIESADEGEATTAIVNNLSSTVRELMQESADTVAHGFLVFAFKGKVHMMVSMDTKLNKVITTLAQEAKEDGWTPEALSAYFCKVLA
jgi:ParB/RepB/Spo0J family partition protein